MRIIKVSLDKTRRNKTPMVACIGYFDGLHVGHQKLLEKTRELGEKYHCETAMITFEPDPWVIIKGATNVKHISTMRQRINKAVSLGMDNIVFLEFTRDMSSLSPIDFMNKILGNLNLQGLVCGFDFHFGYKGSGNVQFLQDNAPYEICVVSAVEDEQGKISSTRITKCIEQGHMEEANRLLGSPFCMEGKVIHGKKRGTDMGFPTANVQVSDEYIIPKNGVYAGKIHVGRNSYGCMINIGLNPTFHDVDAISLEANIFDFHEDIYGQVVSVDFLKFIRPEKQFRSKSNLVMQLEQDKRTIQKYFEEGVL